MAGKAKKAAEEMKQYRVTNRLLSWRGEDGKEVHAQEGDIITDVPKGALVWYLSEGHVVEVGAETEKEEGGSGDDSTDAH